MNQHKTEHISCEQEPITVVDRMKPPRFLLDQDAEGTDSAQSPAEASIILTGEEWGALTRPDFSSVSFSTLSRREIDRAPSSVWATPKRAVKRSGDIMLSMILGLAILPFALLVAAAILLVDGRPVIFSQERLGLNGRLFKCLKFRTMRNDAQERLEAVLAEDEVAALEWLTTQKIRNDPRATWLGRFLRRSSIDEIPQFLNVVRGDMSLVGPRPILTTEAWRYGKHIEAYKSVQPGITGLWQVSGRNSLTYRQRVAADTAYARNLSVWRDLLILCRTPFAILRSEKWD